MALNDIGKAGDLGRGLSNLAETGNLYDYSGALVVMDFYLKAMLDGRGWQVRAGTITTPLVGDVAITDTAAEMCVDPASGITLLPVKQTISIRLGGGTLHEYATKSVASASTAGAAFVPLPLMFGETSPGFSARVEAAGAVTVTAEVATTTRRHWSFAQPIAMGAYVTDTHWEPRTPPPIKHNGATPTCLYTQIAATGTGPSYYANLDVLSFASATLGLS